MVKAKKGCEVVVNKLLSAAIVWESKFFWAEGIEELRFVAFSVIGVKGWEGGES